MVRAELLHGLRAHGLKPDELQEHARRIAARQEDPFATAAQMVKAIYRRRPRMSKAHRKRGTNERRAKIDHLGIAVESIAAARGFYEALGSSCDA